jgi:phosphoglycerol transferase MdoB-like AlkP superfamily enzyme
MIAIVHSILGIAIGKKIKNNILSWFLALTSHFILDLIPHSEYSQSSHLFTLITIDLLASFFILFLIIRKEKKENILRIVIAFLLSILPDNIVFFERFFSDLIISIPLISQYLLIAIKEFSHFHNSIHIPYSPNILFGTLNQILIISFSFLLIFKNIKKYDMIEDREADKIENRE